MENEIEKQKKIDLRKTKGRHKLKEEDKRSRFVGLRYTEKEFLAISKLSQKLNLDFSPYVRTISLQGIEYFNKFKTVEELNKMRHEIRKIGVNINQIAKRINADDKRNHFTDKELLLINSLSLKIYELLDNYKSIDKVLKFSKYK